MPWDILVVLGLLIGVVYGAPLAIKAMLPKPPAPPKFIPVHLFGGPHHDTTQQIREDEKPQFFIAQYLPTDEEGMPKEENLLKADEQRAYFRPSYAYYQAVTDEDYFYVRDVTPQEIQKMQTTGKLPSPEFEEE